ncbi:MAG: hypothetical protein Q7S28_00410 [bacterium]|nr:hypothetical protein [bacterium]
MEKLTIGKNENLADVIERMVTSDESDVTLVVPKGSALKSSPNNFHLLARESSAAKKSLTIESVDDEVLALAKASKLRASHPLFKDRIGGGMLSDIVTGEENVLTRKSGKGGVKLSLPGERRAKKEESVPLHTDPEVPEEEDSNEGQEEALPPASFHQPGSFYDTKRTGEAERADRSERKRRGKRSRLAVVLTVLIVLAVVMGGGMWAAARFFGHVEITLNFKKVPWKYDSSLTANAATVKPDLNAKLLPLQIFSATKNLTQFFAATGKSGDMQKAKGTVTIYNAYGTQSQQLVATTRFMMPDGKIFRLDAGVTVPGAKMVSGKLTPSSVKAAVTADVAGPDYNVPATPKLTIPGFKGTPKYEGFYGAFESGTTGGSLAGGKPTPTEADIGDAKTKMSDILNNTFKGNFLKTVPDEFVVVDGASIINISKMTVYSQVDEAGKFSAFAEGQFTALGFRASDVKAFVEAARDKDYSGMQFENEAITYADARPDFAKKELKLTLHAQGTLRPAFDAGAFKSQLMRKSNAEVRALIHTIPGLEDAQVSYWPFWMGKTPSVSERINISTP